MRSVKVSLDILVVVRLQSEGYLWPNIGTLSQVFIICVLLVTMVTVVAVTMKLSDRTLKLSSVTGGREGASAALLHHWTAQSKCLIYLQTSPHFTSAQLSSVMLLHRPDVPSPLLSLYAWRNLN